MTAVEARIRRRATGVPGLDAVLGGGWPQFSFRLVAGQEGLLGGCPTCERAHIQGLGAVPADSA